MKRIGLASAIIAGTFVLGILAVSVAQNDSRRQSSDLEITPTYDEKDVGPVTLPKNMSQMAAKFAIDDQANNRQTPEANTRDVPPPMEMPKLPATVQSGSLEPAANFSLTNQPEFPANVTSNIEPPELKLPVDATVRANDDQFERATESTGTTELALAKEPPPIVAAENGYASLAQAVEPAAESNARNRNEVLSPPTIPGSRSTPGRNISAPPRPSLSLPSGDALTSRGAPSRSPIDASSLPNIPELRTPNPVNANNPTAGNATLANDSRNPMRTVAAPAGLEPPSSRSGLALPNSATTTSSSIAPPPANTIAARPSETPSIGSNLAQRDQPPANRGFSRPENFTSGQPTARTSRPNPNTGTPSRQAEMSSLPTNENFGANQSNLQPIGTVDAIARLAQSKPGARNLDGSQRPVFEMQKRAPQEIQVGVPVVFSTLVRNVGNAAGYEVKVVDRIPAGTRLTQTVPTAQVVDDLIVWTFDKIDPGGEQTLSMELVAEQEGEVGSVASISFSSLASVRTVSTKPVLEVRQSSDPSVRIGNPTIVNIAVSNSGSGVARDVTIQADVPRGLRHPSGSEIEVAVGDLQPGETRTVELEVMAAEPGMSRNIVRAVAANLAEVSSQTEIEVIAPKLDAAISGPSRRFLERPATYQLTVTNSGTAIARNIEMITYLDQGLQFVSAINAGEYLPNNHAAAWGLDELQPGATATTELTVMPVQEGEFVLRLQAEGDGVNAEPIAKNVRVEGQSELSFTVSDDNDPVETYGETTYTINIANIGTRVDHDVQLMIELPQGATVRDVSAPVAYQANDSQLLFEPISEMKAKDQQTIRFTLAMAAEGVQVLRAHLRSELRPVEVIKEESTQVYLDR